MRRAARALVVALCALATVVGASLAQVLTLDANAYRADVAAVLARVTGRDATVGRVRLDLSLEPRLVVHDLALADAPGSRSAAMLNVASVELHLDLGSMLSGRVRVTRLVVDGAVLSLSRGHDGRANWAFLGAARAGPPRWRYFPGLDALSVTGSVVRFADARRALDIVLELDRLDATPNGTPGRVALELAGRLDGEPLTVAGATGYPLDLLTGADWPVDVAVTAPGLEARLAGTAAPVDASLDVQLTLDAAPDALARITGFAPPADQRVSVAARLAASPTSLSLGGIDATLDDEATVTGDLMLDLAAVPPRVDGRLDADRLDLAALAARYRTAGGADGGTVDRLKRVDGRLELAVAALTAGRVEAEDARVSLLVDGARIALSPASAIVAGARVRGSLTADLAAEPPAIRLTLRGAGLSSSRLLTLLGQEPLLRGPVHVALDLGGRGRTRDALVRTLAGDARLFLDSGQMQTDAVDPLVGGLTAMLDSSDPVEAGWTSVNCIAADFEVARGIARRRALLVDTRHATIVGDGHVDLARERLDLKLTPRPKSTTLNLAVPVHVGGTFEAPTFAPGVLGTARRIGGVVGAVLFPPAAVAVFADFGTGEDHPCLAHASDPSRLEVAGRQPARAKPPKSDVIDDLGRGLKRLFGN